MDLEKIEKQINHGNKILEELFKLSDKEIKVKIKDIIDKRFHDIVNNAAIIRRIIEHERPVKIEIYFWDKLIIEWFGIDFESEYGNKKRIREFDTHFVL
jgi:hypothetical protein